MRWITFSLCAVFFLTLQTTVAPLLEIAGARPDWLLAVVVVYAMHAPMRDACIGAWIIGAAADLMTLERFGLMAMSYLVAALIVVRAREYVFRDRGQTQFWMTLLVCLLVRAAWLAYRSVFYGIGPSVWQEVMSSCVVAAVYTAACAPLFYRVMSWAPTLFGITSAATGYRDMTRSRTTRV